jgi:hypothetical protein
MALARQRKKKDLQPPRLSVQDNNCVTDRHADDIDNRNAFIFIHPSGSPAELLAQTKKKS